MWDLWNFSFSGRGDVSPTHSEICRFVSGSYAKHQVSPPVITLLKKMCLHRPSRWCLGEMWLDFPLLRCQGLWKKICTRLSLSQILVQNPKNYSLGMFKDSAIILSAIRRSFLTKSATAAVFTSVRVDFGRPLLSSSSTSSLPSRNREYHLKTFDRFTASFP
jgi:hypothetical protein